MRTRKKFSERRMRALLTLITTMMVFTASADFPMRIDGLALLDRQFETPIEEYWIQPQDELVNTKPVDNTDRLTQYTNFESLSEDEIVAYRQVIRNLSVGNYYHQSYRTVGVVSTSQQSTSQQSRSSYTTPGPGVPAGRVDCFAHRASNAHKGTWFLENYDPVQWVKAKSSARCRYIQTGPAAAPRTMGWRMTLILQRDADLWDCRFFKEGKNVEWLQDDGPRNGTQITSRDCKNDDYLHSSFITVIPPEGYVYTGFTPVSVDWSLAEVDNCP